MVVKRERFVNGTRKYFVVGMTVEGVDALLTGEVHQGDF